MIDPNYRYDMLREVGYTNREIEESVNVIHKTRKQRYKSAESNELTDKVNEVMEDMSKKLKSLSKSKEKRSEIVILVETQTLCVH